MDASTIGSYFYSFLYIGSTGRFAPLFTGATIKHLPRQQLAKVEIEMPHLPVQKRIADVLSAYDDLIENNRRRIQLLEQAARLLYKEWFVHLRFPGHEHVKIIDGVPDGWERKPFSELATFLNGFAFKPAHLGDVGLPIVKIPELRNGPTTKTPRNIGEHIPEKHLLHDGDILFSWSGTLLVNIWNHGEGLLNQHLFKVTPNSENLRGLVYFALKQALFEFQNQTTGATMKHIRKGALDKIASLTPTSALLDEFEGAVAPILDQISKLQKQTTGALKARDLLLPRLMNGEVAV
jgi:type I restriction enzyme, S subunit